jgi:mannose-6-phosphate isomerase-like protein (cupin superfamily)
MTKHISASETLARLPGSAGQRFLEVFSHGSLVVEIYAPELVDPRTHMRDEVYVVISGKGTYL